jgi:carboxylesterase type B
MDRKHKFAERRARNLISRRKDLALRCAELLDEGLTDLTVAQKLSGEFKLALPARTVASFRKADYAPIAAERLARQDAAREVELIISSARESGATFAKAGIDLLSKAAYDMIKAQAGSSDFNPVSIGKMLAKFVEVETNQIRAQTDAENQRRKNAVDDALQDKSLTAAERQRRVDEAFGMKPKQAA